MQALVGAVRLAGEWEACPYSPDHEDADLEVTKLMLQVKSYIQIKNTRDTKGHEGERKRLAEEMLLNEQVEKSKFCAGEKKEKVSGKIRWRGERHASAQLSNFLASSKERQGKVR